MSNCQNCGAALPTNSPVCTYCNTRNFVDFKSYASANEHQVSTRKCSLCTSPMDTIDVGTAEHHLHIEKCPSCHGLFFDNGEVEQMMEIYTHNPASINRARLHELCELAMESGQRKTYIPCPVCSELMNRQLLGAKSGVIADICHDHGIFFEPGEIRQLIEWKRAGGEIHDQNVQDNKPKPKPRKAVASHEFEDEHRDGWGNRRQGSLLEVAIDAIFDLFD